jgi:hypothetical protein
MDDAEKGKFLISPRLELGRPALSQSLYRLRYLGPILRGVLSSNEEEAEQLLKYAHMY